MLKSHELKQWQRDDSAFIPCNRSCAQVGSIQKTYTVQAPKSDNQTSVNPTHDSLLLGLREGGNADIIFNVRKSLLDKLAVENVFFDR